MRFLFPKVRCFVTLESDMNSMERLLQTLQTTPTEGNKASAAAAATGDASSTRGDEAKEEQDKEAPHHPRHPQHRPPIDWKSPLPGSYDATGAPAAEAMTAATATAAVGSASSAVGTSLGVPPRAIAFAATEASRQVQKYDGLVYVPVQSPNSKSNW
jgi:hypothetical protein